MEYTWNDVFREDESSRSVRFEKCRANNQKIYDSVTEENYHTLDDCVKYAIENQNHCAFVHYFLKILGNSREKRFSEKLLQYIGKQKLRDNEIKVIDMDCWRSWDFQYNEENIDKRGLSESSVRRWRMGESRPERDCIVQIGFYFHLDSKQVDELLIAAEYVKLYPLDIVDRVSIYYLDQYAADYETTPYEKIKVVKTEINKYLRKYPNDMILLQCKGIYSITSESELTEEQLECVKRIKRLFPNGFDNTKDKKIIKESEEWKELETYGLELEWNKKDKRYKIYKIMLKGHRLAFSEEIGWNIEDEIERYKKLLNNQKEEVDNSIGLTSFYREKLDKGRKGGIEKFMESGRVFDKNKECSIFTQKYYSFLYNTLKYIENEEQYKKNLYYSPLELIIKKGDYAEIEEKSGNLKIGRFIDGYCEKFYKGLQNDKKEKLKVLIKIWNLYDVLNEEDNEENFLGEKPLEVFGEKNIINKLIRGRNYAHDKNYCISNNEEDKTTNQKAAYICDLGEKSSIIKLVLVTGNEDKIQEYLSSAGFINKDFYNMSEEELKCADRLEVLFLYALKYRDALIEKWADIQDKDKKLYKNKVKEKFPLIKLFMVINRDIQFVLGRLKTDVGKKDRADYLKILKNYIPYPYACCREKKQKKLYYME